MPDDVAPLLPDDLPVGGVQLENPAHKLLEPGGGLILVPLLAVVPAHVGHELHGQHQGSVRAGRKQRRQHGQEGGHVGGDLYREEASYTLYGPGLEIVSSFYRH